MLQVRVIDAQGENHGVISIDDALEIADEAGLDLVEVSPQVQPPVCKVLDYGKYKFEQEKKVKESRKKQKLLKLKEIRMQPKIEKHDLGFKSKHVHIEKNPNRNTSKSKQIQIENAQNSNRTMSKSKHP